MAELFALMGSNFRGVYYKISVDTKHLAKVT